MAIKVSAVPIIGGEEKTGWKFEVDPDTGRCSICGPKLASGKDVIIVVLALQGFAHELLSKFTDDFEKEEANRGEKEN
jgi:hypothetical protein